MGQQLNIDSDEAVQLAAELAGLHSQSVEAAVTRALRDTLERDRLVLRNADQAELDYKALRMIVDEIHRHLQHPLPLSNHDWLYDGETGLPR